MRAGSNYAAGWIAEETVQAAFRTAGTKLPQVTPMPTMRSLYDPSGERAAWDREAEKELKKEIPLWQRPVWLWAVMAVVLCAMLYGLWRLAKRL